MAKGREETFSLMNSAFLFIFCTFAAKIEFSIINYKFFMNFTLLVTVLLTAVTLVAGA